ncbi:MAG: VOC family protein [Sulfurimonas sp.]|nr:VOC family protein [Sulfurimonas sp.]
MKLDSLVVNMAVKNIHESYLFYKKNFGFELVDAVVANSTEYNGITTELKDDTQYQWAMVKKESTFVMFQTVNSLREDIGNFFETIGASLTFYLTIDDVEKLYIDIKNKVKIVKEIETKFYGMKEFYIKDCNGYILGFGSKA